VRFGAEDGRTLVKCAIFRQRLQRACGQEGDARRCAALVAEFCAPWIGWRADDTIDLHAARLMWRPTPRRDALEAAMAFVVAEPALFPAAEPSRVTLCTPATGATASAPFEVWCVHESHVKAVRGCAQPRTPSSVVAAAGGSSRAEAIGMNTLGLPLTSAAAAATTITTTSPAAAADDGDEGAGEVCAGIIVVETDPVARAVRMSPCGRDGDVLELGPWIALPPSVAGQWFLAAVAHRPAASAATDCVLPFLRIAGW
jgi:hypothetical protein